MVDADLPRLTWGAQTTRTLACTEALDTNTLYIF
jgi:hypothetical protein